MSGGVVFYQTLFTTLEPFDTAWLEPNVFSEEDSLALRPEPLTFFYTLGRWPTQIQNQAVFARIPYQSGGPPKNFLSQIQLHWIPGETEITLYGPQTIAANRTALDLKNCLTRWAGCFSFREKIFEWAGFKKMTSKSWITSQDPRGIEGIRITAVLDNTLEEVFFLFLPGGICQKIKFKTKVNARTPEMKALFYQVLGDLRTETDVQILRKFSAESLKQSEVRKAPQTIAEVYALNRVLLRLAAHLSINGHDFKPFFHFAGVNHTLGKVFFEQKNLVSQQGTLLNFTRQNIASALSYLSHYPEESPETRKHLEALEQDLIFAEKQTQR